MDPIPRDRRWLAALSTTVVLVATATATWLARGAHPLTVGAAVGVALPLAIVALVLLIPVRYVCQALPLGGTSLSRLLVTHGLGALVLSSAWVSLGAGLARFVASLGPEAEPGLSVRYHEHAPGLLAGGALLYLLSAFFHYMVLAVEASRRAEKQSLEMAVLAREAEIKALKAQVHPHFLFNSLNSISSLTTSNPAQAREMCILLAEFFRRSLALGDRPSVSLEEELAVAGSYLAIEGLRFGKRLAIEEAIDEPSKACLLPPLLLQPLVENAIRHGIATLVEGGVVRLTAQSDGRTLRVQVENPFDPESPARPGVGLGLSNVRKRLLVRYGEAAHVDAERAEDHFRVTLLLPGPRHWMIDVLIVDDEEPARAVLREMLSHEADVRILGECASGVEAVKTAAELKPQVVFLDIEMPKLDGFEVLELLDPAVAVVFVTAYDSYALRAFEVHAVDYVLKPFRAERLKEALEGARAHVARRPEPAVLAQAARRTGDFATRVVVKDGSRIHLIPVERLDSAEAQDDYVALRSEGKSYLKMQTLGSLEASLDPAVFVRVHRSHLVRLDRIRAIDLYAKNSRVATLVDGTQVPISREGHARLKELLGDV